jgi:hypothetical protein
LFFKNIVSAIISLAKEKRKISFKKLIWKLKNVILEKKPLYQAIFSRNKQQLNKILKSIKR